MFGRGRPEYVRQDYIGWGVSNRRKLRPIAFFEVRRREVLERNVLEWGLPAGNAEPDGIILNHRKIDLIPVFHDQRLVICDEIRQRRDYKQAQNNNQTPQGEQILSKLP